MKFVIGTIIMLIGGITPIMTHKIYIDEYFRLNKSKAGLIFTGSFILIIMGCYLMIHSEI